MNAADAARMSDPLLNPHFRRRWAEARSVVQPSGTSAAPPALPPLEQAATDIHLAWRATRTSPETNR
jgi:hypothetical protein